MLDQNISHLFFFFQAEDGIRDLYVTGVQTCALPISSARRASARAAPASRRSTSSRPPPPAGTPSAPPGSSSPTRSSRSEERRVGKGGGCRSWPDAYETTNRTT